MFNFISECRPKVLNEGTMVYLKNKNTGHGLKCYMKTLNRIIDAVPEGFTFMKQLSTEGEDTKYLEKVICTYGQNVEIDGEMKRVENQIVLTVQRYKNSLSLMVQMKFDREGNGQFSYSRRAVQFALEDNLEELRNFGHTMIEKYVEYCSGQRTTVPEIDFV